MKNPWPLRALVWYLRRPLIGYLILLLVSMSWALSPRGAERTLFTVFAFPWVALGIAILNLPLVGAAFRKMSLSLSARRNHALEHGTIQIIRRSSGAIRGIGGKAATDGFRISGVKSEAVIRQAFAEFLTLPRDEQMALAVADNCGSMLVVAQGLGLLLVGATTILVLLLQPGTTLGVLLFTGQCILFLAGRRPLGRLIQRRRLLALDFGSARIHHIKKVPVHHLLETPPVFFVQTRVAGASSREERPAT